MPGDPRGAGERMVPAVRFKQKAPGQKTRLRASHPQPSAAQPISQEQIDRLKEVIVQLEGEREKILRERDMCTRACQDVVGESESTHTGLRWKLNQLEGEKLDLVSQHNQEVSQLHAQVARLRAQVERGEATRQTLEYDIAVATRDAAFAQDKAEARVAEMQKENHELKDMNTELCQTAEDLQRALEISRQAREEDLQGLTAELAERDQLLVTAHTDNDQLTTEKTRLLAVLQEQEGTLHKLKERLEGEQREREKDRRSADKERRCRKELEMKLKTVETALKAEQSVQQEMTSGLAALRERLKEAESSQTRYKKRANDVQAKLEQVEKEHAGAKAELNSLVQEERETCRKLRGTIQELHIAHTHSQEQLTTAFERRQVQEEEHEMVMKQLSHLLQEHGQQGETNTSNAEESKPSFSAMLDGVRRVLDNYQKSLTAAQSQVQSVEEKYLLLCQDVSQKEEVSSSLQKTSQEHAERVCVLTEELKRLRCNYEGAQSLAAKAQSRLEELTQHCQEAHTHLHTLRDQQHRDQQERLEFLHSLYQRLVAGCVLMKSPQGMMGSFSWPELCAALQDQADLLLTDLHSTKEQVQHLEEEVERRARSLREMHEAHSDAIEALTSQLRLREQDWLTQKEEMLKQHTALTDQLHQRTQELRSKADASKERLSATEHEKARLSTRASDLRERLKAAERLSSSLLHSAALLAGCLWPLLRRTRDLARQKRALQGLLDGRGTLEREVQAILLALGNGDPEDGDTAGTHTLHKPTTTAMGTRIPTHTLAWRRKGMWGFRRAVIGVLAAGRFRVLARVGARVCFTAENPYGEGTVCVSVCAPSERRIRRNGEEEEKDEEVEWTQGTKLKSLILTCSEDGTDVAIRFSRLLERLVCESDRCHGYHSERGSLVRLLAQGLYRLRKTQPPPPQHYNSKSVVSSLQQHILAFTQRLHAAEVERRNLRLELAQLKRQAHALPPQPPQDPKHTACVPAARVQEMLLELSAALQREQQAQELLHQQATQLQELGLSMELHAGEQQEKDRTLATAVKSLSECKAELRRKDQSLRQLGKHLSQSQQERQELQQSIHTAENALRMAAKSKDSLASYMKAVESSLNEVRERIMLPSPCLSSGDIVWHVPSMHLEMAASEMLMGGPEVATCQSFVSCFAEVFQLLCGKLACVEREMESRRSHIHALKEELHRACLRETSPVKQMEEEYAPLPMKDDPVLASGPLKKTNAPAKRTCKKH
ncbi:coiled-coil domain-containing protein 171-like isoform X2 [Engraulis encrasicolus]|uniref:coiled-coil domain-containing protein 171-like isoform X2 n=1 Tax=Engraulis encrasicolus TaxID=184585 RepID=UPI002FD56B52